MLVDAMLTAWLVSGLVSQTKFTAVEFGARIQPVAVTDTEPPITDAPGA
jgi:hypothetical protein